MNPSRTAQVPAITLEWQRHRRALLNRCLAGTALLLITVLIAAIVMYPAVVYAVAPGIIIAVFVGALIWIIGIYALGHWQRIGLAGAALVLLSLTTLALLAYLFHSAAPLLLPLVVVPVALAALLLTPAAVYVTALAALCAVVGALVVAELIPPPFAPDLNAIQPLTASLIISAITVTLVTLLIVPVRTSVLALRRRAEADDVRRSALEQQRLMAEAARNDALDQLNRQRQLVEALTQLSGNGLLAVDHTGTVTHASPAAKQLWVEAGSGDLVGAPLGRVSAALEAAPPARRLATLAPLPTDRPLPIDGFTHVLCDQREHARFVRLRGELLGLLTDEMRNPLTSMLTGLDLTLGQKQLPEDTDRVLIGVRHNGQRLVDLVTLLLEISQIEQQIQPFVQSTISLRRVLEAGLAQVAPVAQQGAVTVTLEYGAEQPFQADPERLRRAFIYLLDYAVRRSPPYSTVQVRTEQQPQMLLLRITDQGPTLTAAERTALFDQRGQTSDRGGQGSLGLAFAHLVIERHGGRVWAEPSNNQGNALVITLPL
jgi:signal transduction histidine kinase